MRSTDPKGRSWQWAAIGLLALGVLVAKTTEAPVWLFSVLCIAFVLTVGFAALLEARATREPRA